MKHIPNIFRDEQVQQDFDKKGFVVIPFLSENEIHSIQELFDKHFPDVTSNTFGSSTYLSDFRLKKKISDGIDEVILPSIERNFVNYTPFGSAFLYKSPGPQSELCAHQDWTIVDEENAVAINIWFPLVNTTVENGTLSVLPGSHYKNLATLRSPTLPFFFQGNEDLIHEKMIPLSVEAGQAVVLNQSLIHYSSPNLSDKLRVSVTSGIRTKDAQMIFLYKDQSNQESNIEKYYTEDYFMQSFEDFFSDIHKRPSKYSFDIIDQKNQSALSRTELEKFLTEIS